MDEIKIQVPDSVYPPFEDTQLLAKAALKLCSGKILEVGCGSGYVSICLAKFKKNLQQTAVDINSKAVEATKKNAKENKVKIEILNSDLFSKVKDKDYDWILFNPPYLPTSEAQKIEGGLNFAFDGGETGLDTAYRFLEQVKNYLKKDGKILLVVSTAQDLVKLNEKIRMCSFEHKIVAQESFFFEKIYVYKLRRM